MKTHDRRTRQRRQSFHRARSVAQPGGCAKLIRHWSLIQIGATTPPALDQWSISSREFRENLEWAVIVPGQSDISPAVTQLLDELSARGIKIHDARSDSW